MKLMPFLWSPPPPHYCLGQSLPKIEMVDQVEAMRSTFTSKPVWQPPLFDMAPQQTGGKGGGAWRESIYRPDTTQRLIDKSGSEGRLLCSPDPPLSPSIHLRFNSQGKCYQFICLPSGQSSAPWSLPRP